MLNSLVGIIASSGGATGSGAYESIATVNGTGSSGIVTFSSIPATYQHLQIRCIVKDVYTSGLVDSIYLRFNGTTGTLYGSHNLNGNGATASASAISNANEIEIPKTIPDSNASFADVMGVAIIDLHDYASTTRNKTLRSISGANANTTTTDFRVNLSSGLWRSTAAINQITIHTNIDRFTTTSSFALYGIKGA
jgi:hypothetical protein